MALRMIEIITPTANLDQLTKLLEEEDEVHGVWSDPLTNDQSRTRVLIQANRTEATTDLVRQRLGTTDGFRMMLFAVEAAVPMPEEPAKEEKEVAAPVPAKNKAKFSDRVSREELYADLAAGAKLSKVYVLMVVLSAIVAAIGLIRDNVAVVVGAMVIAPLLGPNVSLALGTTLGDIPLTLKSLKTNIVGIATAFIIAVAIGAMVPVDATVKEIASRTGAGVSDVVLALAAGSAGTLAYTSGIPASLVGVMVAVALLPPLVTAGLLAGSGYTSLALGALVLVLTNVVCINLSGVLTFLAQRVRPRTWWEEKKAKKATRRAITLWMVILLVLIVVILRLWEIVGPK
jgi:uncharacterized hydrophobic protein (TIGR00341 family)